MESIFIKKNVKLTLKVKGVVGRYHIHMWSLVEYWIITPNLMMPHFGHSISKFWLRLWSVVKTSGRTSTRKLELSVDMDSNFGR